jgi:hypothetical protein
MLFIRFSEKKIRKILDKCFFLVLIQLILLMFWENLQIFSITKKKFKIILKLF